MARRKKEIVVPHLNDCGGDLTKKWYVEYSIKALAPIEVTPPKLISINSLQPLNACAPIEKFACGLKLTFQIFEFIKH